MCELINILVAHSQNLFNSLSKDEKDMITRKYGPFTNSPSINQLNFISVLMNFKCSDEKMIEATRDINVTIKIGFLFFQRKINMFVD